MSGGTAPEDGRFAVDRGDPGPLERLPVAPRTVGLLATWLVLAAAGLWEELVTTEGVVPFWGFATGIIEYLYYASLAVVAWYLVVPLARRPDLRRRYWRRLRRKPLALASAAYLLLLWYAATFGTWTLSVLGIESTDNIRYGVPAAQPPAWTAVEMSPTIPYCLASREGDMCPGTWTFPLGTTVDGNGMVHLMVEGARVAVQVSLVTAALVVPFAVVVGTVAAYYGGRVDALLMRYVDLQRVVPAVFVVLLVQESFNRSLVTIVVVFGLFDWDGTARLVRSAAASHVDAGYVRAARDAGMSDLAIVRTHVVPNVGDTVVAAVADRMPTLVLVEAGIAYLGFTNPLAQSWGSTIAIGFSRFPELWWTVLFAAVPLVLTVAAMSVLGDALRDVLDPRAEVSA
ncbi:ABC transporter permease [Halobaculum sp. CBA1158]|uniref:ABC transporter permease n=1 Tax=Halobaculum sp. CBA1158 TaxID=2904243 RepID=UPI001F3D8B2B|nr:ABC transporter permease [Halobaculum sp. CBA1158]UIP00576.1 ABC transporter permease [Halobaculum sp. CBA1158]